MKMRWIFPLMAALAGGAAHANAPGAAQAGRAQDRAAGAGMVLAAASAPEKAKAGETGKPGGAIKDCSDCPEMIAVPEGRFQMGTPDTEEGHFREEGPVHAVAVKAFALGKTHVTREQFAAFAAATGHQAAEHCWLLTDEWHQFAGKNWRDPGFAQGNNHPVVCVSWNEANDYVKWLSEKTGKRYRLPSEAEWEYAARANTSTARFWGNDPNQACGYANVADEATRKSFIGKRMWPTYTCLDNWVYTAPAASFKPNGFGLYDMIGNAWEWVQDCWNGNYTGAPADGSARTSGQCDEHVLRGAGWVDAPAAGRVGARFRRASNDRFFSIGFRVARDLP